MNRRRDARLERPLALGVVLMLLVARYRFVSAVGEALDSRTIRCAP